MDMNKRRLLISDCSVWPGLIRPMRLRCRLASLLRRYKKGLRSLQSARKKGYAIAGSVAALLFAALAVSRTSERNLPTLSDSLDNGEIRLGVQGFGTIGGCSLWSPEGHGNWNVFQSCQTNNPTELQVYPNAAEGIAEVTSGTNQVTRKTGTAFSTSWIGLPYFYYEGIAYRVATVVDATHLTVQSRDGGTVKWKNSASGTYYFLTTSVTATCDVNGTAVTRSSGQPFIPFYDLFYINGIARTISKFNSPSSLTLSSNAGALTGATCVQYKNINNELSTLRLQGLWGADEENFAITETPAGTLIQSTYAGSGKYRPIFIEDGEDPVGTQQIFLSIRPNPALGNAGALGIGGDTDTGNQAIEVTPNPRSVNYWLIQGGSTGFAPSLACRGADSRVGCGIDMQGASTLSVTSHSFGNMEFEVFGNGGTSWLAAGSSLSSSPTMSANGSASNINVVLAPKGTGVTQSTGPVQLPMYTVAKLPPCGASNVSSMAAVTDQNGAPGYRGALTGSGNLRVPVYCGFNGSTYSWEAH
jgi:hypothetical protein